LGAGPLLFVNFTRGRSKPDFTACCYNKDYFLNNAVLTTPFESSINKIMSQIIIPTIKTARNTNKNTSVF
ncbi:MAG: hypothetical protein UFR15_02405, partial [Succiniclasticum sp.]|nr:hypothetical protein [Succiniclasticum sp.]